MDLRKHWEQINRKKTQSSVIVRRAGRERNELLMNWNQVRFLFLQVFQEFRSISGQDLVDAINDCYDGYFQELLVAIGTQHIILHLISRWHIRHKKNFLFLILFSTLLRCLIQSSEIVRKHIWTELLFHAHVNLEMYVCSTRLWLSSTTICSLFDK